MRRVDAVLRIVAEEASKAIPPREVENLVAEVRLHLEDSIQARLELGATADEAEREAIAAFGSAQAVGKGVEPMAPLVDRRFLAWALAAVGYWLVVGPRSWPAWAMVFVLGPALVVHVGFWVASARAKRPQWIVFVAIFGTLWLAYSVPNALGEAEFIRDNIAGGFARNRTWHAVLDRKEKSLAESYVRFAAGLDDRGPSRVPSYEPDGTLRLLKRPDQATAATRWAQAISNAAIGFRYERADLAESDARQAWLARTPWYGLLPQAMGRLFATTGWCVAAFYLGTHLFAWVLGQLLRRRPRRRVAA